MGRPAIGAGGSETEDEMAPETELKRLITRLEAETRFETLRDATGDIVGERMRTDDATQERIDRVMLEAIDNAIGTVHRNGYGRPAEELLDAMAKPYLERVVQRALVRELQALGVDSLRPPGAEEPADHVQATQIFHDEAAEAARQKALADAGRDGRLSVLDDAGVPIHETEDPEMDRIIDDHMSYEPVYDPESEGRFFIGEVNEE
jgi:hypothetical protein